MRQCLRSIAVWVIALLFLTQVIVAIPRVQAMWEGPLQHPDWNYEQKMRSVWGWSPHFDFMLFVQSQTPETATLLGDPNYRFITLNLYFLYPRKLIYGNEETLRKHAEIDYVMITEGFPNFPVNGEKMMFDDKHGLYRILK